MALTVAAHRRYEIEHEKRSPQDHEREEHNPQNFGGFLLQSDDPSVSGGVPGDDAGVPAVVGADGPGPGRAGVGSHSGNRADARRGVAVVAADGSSAAERRGRSNQGRSEAAGASPSDDAVRRGDVLGFTGGHGARGAEELFRGHMPRRAEELIARHDADFRRSRNGAFIGLLISKVGARAGRRQEQRWYRCRFVAGRIGRSARIV